MEPTLVNPKLTIVNSGCRLSTANPPAKTRWDEKASTFGGVGAWELAARHSTVDLNSNVVSGVSQSVTGGIYGGQQQIAALALSWYPNDWLRFMLQFQYVKASPLGLPTVPGLVARNDRGRVAASAAA